MLPPQTFGYVDVRDVALGHLKAYENENAEGRHILCTACLDGFELMDLIREIEPDLELPSKIVPMWKMNLFARWEITKSKFGYVPRISPETVKEYMNKITNYDANKAKGVLGWNPMDIKDSLRDTMNWIKHNLS